MTILDSAELLLQARNYSGSGDWLDESGNGHHAQLGSTSGADANDPFYKAWTGIQYVYFPGTASNNFTIAGLSITTTYDYTVTYEDDSTNVGEETTDGSGNLVLGNTQSNFSDVDVKDVSVEPDGGGAEVAGIAASAFTEPFASATGRQSLTWTINRSGTGLRTTVVDRPMFLYTSDDFHLVTDHANLDFNDADWSMMVAVRFNTVSAEQALYSKYDFTQGQELSIRADPVVRVRGASSGFNNINEAGTPVLLTMMTAGGVYDDTAAQIEAFFDGVGSGAPESLTLGDQSNAHDPHIGSRSNGTQIFTEGAITGVALWRSVLSDAQMSEAHDLLIAVTEPVVIELRGSIPIPGL